MFVIPSLKPKGVLRYFLPPLLIFLGAGIAMILALVLFSSETSYRQMEKSWAAMQLESLDLRIQVLNSFVEESFRDDPGKHLTPPSIDHLRYKGQIQYLENGDIYLKTDGGFQPVFTQKDLDPKTLKERKLGMSWQYVGSLFGHEWWLKDGKDAEQTLVVFRKPVPSDLFHQGTRVLASIFLIRPMESLAPISGDQTTILVFDQKGHRYNGLIMPFPIKANSVYLDKSSDVRDMSRAVLSKTITDPKSQVLHHKVAGNTLTWHVYSQVLPSYSGSPIFILVARDDSGYFSLLMGHLLRGLGWFFLLMVLVFLGTLYYSQKLSQIIHGLNDAARRIGSGDWDFVIPSSGEDVLGDLSYSLQQMAKRLKGLVGNLENLVTQRTKNLQEVIGKYSRANRELERTNKTKDRFFSIIAHDLKSPFTALKGYSGLIEDSFESFTEDQLKEMISKIAVASEEAHGLLDNLLQWAVFQSGSIRVKWETFSLSEVSLEVLDLMKINAKVKGVKLSSNIERKVWVEADRNMISTVIRNLVSNSIKFSKSDDAHVSLSCEIVGDKVLLRITDNGIGIAAENINKLFKSDVYFSQKGTQNEQGTGIGLGLCQEFVTMNQGEISVSSVLNQGTSFTISLRKSEAPEEANDVPSSHYSILCVDDSEDNHNLIAIYLKDQPWDIEFAVNGKIALERIKHKRFDIILMDLNMPVMGGVETTINIRKIERIKGLESTYIMAFTSSVLQEDIDTAIGAGCDSYIVKPIKKQKLINAIEKVTKRRFVS
ncbi:MAG: response regulator [Pseudobacteriovorax sp.]|nr:response regulator [Pseudobacteriovorax sp.]